jgi:methyltransferase (TIGR00027 family)
VLLCWTIDCNLARVIADGQPSLTAFTAAAARAAHLIVDDEPLIFADVLAEAMLGDRADELIGYHRAHGTHPVLAGARAQVTCRSRYTEDSLARAVRRGVSQYVVLGAGLDSFAYRSAPTGQVTVFEIDHPATQEYKRRVRPAPDGLRFVPVDFALDFAADSLRDGLSRAGFDTAEPAFVGWLGGTMYLDSGAIERTVSVLGGFAPGTEVVVDFMLPTGLRDAAGDMYAELIGQASAEHGEPWLSMLAPDAMAALLTRHGFGTVRDVRQRDMIPVQAWERSDSLRPAELSRIAHATMSGNPGPRAPSRPGETIGYTRSATR